MGFLLPSNDAAMIASGAGVAASWIMTCFEDIRVNNVSANGAYLYLYTTNKDGEKCYPFAQGIFITKFSDDADAFSVEPFSAITAEPSFNGPLVTSINIPTFSVNVSVIPFSEDADNLDRLLQVSSLLSDLEVNMTLCYIRPNPAAMKPFGTFADKTETRYVTFKSGKINEGGLGASISQYRLSARKFSFVFSGITRSEENPPTAANTMRGTWSL